MRRPRVAGDPRETRLRTGRMRIDQQPSFILHARPYRETSLLIDAFTREHGRVGLVARGVRRERSRLLVIVHPDSPEASAKIEEIREAWKKQTGEKSVLRVSQPAQVGF